jgi:hypothetical protein
MSSARVLFLLSLGALALGVSMSACGSKTEVCDNGIDDDGNGAIDCADRACAGIGVCPAWDAGWWGPCAKCGLPCDTQFTCLGEGRWDFENPLPLCEDHLCTAYATGVQLNINVNMSSWVGTTPASITTRFIKKTAQDGSAVDCTRLAAAASGRTVANAGQIEQSGTFQVVGFDVRRPPTIAGLNISIPFVNVETTSDYLLWMELWYGPPDSNTRLPTGNRQGYGCWASGAAGLTAIVAADDCRGDAGTCREIDLTMPPPMSSP